METQTLTTPKCCQTCLYMATHEKCDGCLNTPEDYAEYHKTRAAGEARPLLPDNRYLNYAEGNWMARMMRWELEGKRNIVIGGQGEAEVNTSWTPEETSASLHNVAEQCGYLVGHLARKKDSLRLGITTHDGSFALEWSRQSEADPWQLEYIWQIPNDPQTGQAAKSADWVDSWSRKDCEIWPPEASEPTTE